MTIGAGAVASRLARLELKLLEIRFSKRFDLAEAVDMICNVVAPSPQLMIKLNSEWGNSTKDQAAIDKLLLTARAGAESIQQGSNSTQATPLGEVHIPQPTTI